MIGPSLQPRDVRGQLVGRGQHRTKVNDAYLRQLKRKKNIPNFIRKYILTKGKLLNESTFRAYSKQVFTLLFLPGVYYSDNNRVNLAVIIVLFEQFLRVFIFTSPFYTAMSVTAKFREVLTQKLISFSVLPSLCCICEFVIIITVL